MRLRLMNSSDVSTTDACGFLFERAAGRRRLGQPLGSGAAQPRPVALSGQMPPRLCLASGIWNANQRSGTRAHPDVAEALACGEPSRQQRAGRAQLGMCAVPGGELTGIWSGGISTT